MSKTLSQLLEKTSSSNADILLIENETATNKITKGNFLKEVNEQFISIKTKIEEPISLNKCDEEMLGAIQNKEGETTFNLLSIPREKSVDYSKLKDTDFYSIDVDWSTLTRKTDSVGNWCNNIKYKKGYVKNIVIEIDSEIEETGKLFIYKSFNDGNIQLVKEYNVTGNGKINVNIDKYIEYDFYISTKIANVKYNKSTTMTGASFGSGGDKFIPNFDFAGCFAVGVNYYNLYKIQENTLYNVKMNVLKHCSILPNSNGFDYPIIFDFINKTVTISNIYIVDTSNSFNSKPSYYLFNNKTLTLSDVPDEGYYVIYLLFNLDTKNLELHYSNGESLPLDLNAFYNKLVVCYGLTDRKTYFSFGDINKDYVKVIVKEDKNTDETISDDRYIPKYAEKKIITVLKQKNKFFDKRAVVIGDSVFKGENSADNYRRMKDDNIASVLMEEFCFKSVSNYGIGGSRITSHSDSTFAKKGMVDRYVDMITDGVELVIAEGGTNDFGNNVPMGTLDDLSDNTKFKPALYNFLSGLQTKYKGKTILFVTPTHRKDSKPDNIPNSVGLTLKDYVEAIYEICELLSIEVVDLWKELGFTPFNTTLKELYMPDGLHPSIEGMRKYYTKKICDKVRCL